MRTKNIIILLLIFAFGVCALNRVNAQDLSSRLRGKILLQIQEHGEAWYIYPDDLRRYYLGRPADAFRIMRELGLGISERDYNSFYGYAPSKLSGKILLRVEANGEAYYVNPDDLKMYYLGRPADAFQIMRELGLGITNIDLEKIPTTQEGALTEEELMTLEIFFSNSKLDPEFSCNKVFPIERKMPKTLGVARAALKELFKGLTEEEKNQGYFSWFSDTTKDILKSIKIENNTAYVNLKDIRRIIPNASTSCGSAMFFAQVGTTLKQFPSVNRVIIAIDSKPSIFYEWIQIGCFEGNDFCDETPFKTSN